MKRRTLSFRIAATGLAAASLTWPSVGHAATAKPVTWWIETHPWTCSAQTGPLARQVQLACDATGRCAIASDERSADRRATLVCGGEEWTLEARDAEDALLWTLALGAGDDEARLRKAGVWIARSEGDGPIDVPVATPAPAPAPTALLPASPPPVLAQREVDPTSDDARAARLSLAGMFHASVPRSAGEDFGAAYGARGLLVGSAPRWIGPLFFGVAGTAESSSEKTGYSLMRAGLLAGVHAALGDFRFGASLEGGPAYLHVSQDSSSSAPAVPASKLATDSNAMLVYGQASLFAEWSLPGPIHPFVSPTASWLVDRGSPLRVSIPNAMVGLDVGFVWGHM